MCIWDIGTCERTSIPHDKQLVDLNSKETVKWYVLCSIHLYFDLSNDCQYMYRVYTNTQFLCYFCFPIYSMCLVLWYCLFIFERKTMY